MHAFLRYVLFWLPMPILGIINGTLREFVIKNYVEDQVANRVSVFTLIILIFIYGLAVKNKLNVVTQVEAVVCGVTWMILTVCFEFGFGHFVFGVPYDKLLADYNMVEGRLWPLVLFFTGLLPFILRRLNNVS